GAAAGGDFGELFGEVPLRSIVEVGPRHVQQLGGLVLDGGDDSRVAVAGGADRDAGREVEEAVAVHILHYRSIAAGASQWINAGVRRRGETLVVFNQRLGQWAGEGRFEERDLSGSGHGGLLRGSQVETP